MRGATEVCGLGAVDGLISTHTPLAGRDPVECSSSDADGISTHAPLAGRDRRARVDDGKPRLISTHAPLAGRDLQCRTIPASGRDFNPRAPCGARQDLCLSVLAQLNFNPRAPCGARQCGFGTNYYQFNISTHAPLAGRDARWSTAPKAKAVFQPTRPLRGATANPTLSHTCHPYFNPRAPCGARLQKCTNHYAHFCDNRQISDAFAQNADCQGILFLFDAGKPCGFWVRTAQVISARLCFAL